MHAIDTRTGERLLQQPSIGLRFPVSVPFGHDSLQPLLLDLPRQIARVYGDESPWDIISGSCSRYTGSTEGRNHL